MPTDATMTTRGWGPHHLAGSGRLYRARHIVTMKHAGLAIATRRELVAIWAALLDRLIAAGLELNATVDDWSYADRDIRGSVTSLSYHAWGLAIDVDATTNPSVTPGHAHVTTMPADTAGICAGISPRLVWGGSWGDPYDPMHFEWQGTVAEAKATVARLGGKRIVKAALQFPVWYRRQLAYGARGEDVKRLQQFLHAKADGIFLSGTEQALRDWQARQGLRRDGVFGRASAKVAARRGA